MNVINVEARTFEAMMTRFETFAGGLIPCAARMARKPCRSGWMDRMCATSFTSRPAPSKRTATTVLSLTHASGTKCTTSPTIWSGSSR